MEGGGGGGDYGGQGEKGEGEVGGWMRVGGFEGVGEDLEALLSL